MDHVLLTNADHQIKLEASCLISSMICVCQLNVIRFFRSSCCINDILYVLPAFVHKYLLCLMAEECSTETKNYWETHLIVQHIHNWWTITTPPPPCINICTCVYMIFSQSRSFETCHPDTELVLVLLCPRDQSDDHQDLETSLSSAEVHVFLALCCF